VAVPLTDLERRVFEVDAAEQLTPMATAYIRARGAGTAVIHQTFIFDTSLDLIPL
jgi:hypothetical protein